MSRLAELKARREILLELESIFQAMKNLATIEMNKVARIIPSQLRVSHTITSAMAELEYFYPMSSLQQKGDNEMDPNDNILCVLIGSERGFCGSFNDNILNLFEEQKKRWANLKVGLVGKRLALKWTNESEPEWELEGPNSADEVPRLVHQLSEKLLPYASDRWMIVQNVESSSEVPESFFFPLEHRLPINSGAVLKKPLITLEEHELYAQLLEQYLFSIMHQVFYTSLMQESRARLQHMDGALNRVKRRIKEFSLQLNSQRQEEITEEIEILMLSSMTEADKTTMDED